MSLPDPNQTSALLLNHLVGANEQRSRERVQSTESSGFEGVRTWGLGK
jgi:hypothetical protein